jgi:hypothetical protein
MITRRKALAYVSTSLLASTGFGAVANAQFNPFNPYNPYNERGGPRERVREREIERAREAAIARDRERARQEAQRIIATLDPWKTSPVPISAHYEATIALLNFFALLTPFETENSIRRVSFLDMIKRIGDINLKVNTALEIRKHSDQLIKRTLSTTVKSDKTTQSDIRINKIIEILNPYFSGEGLYSHEHSRLHHRSLIQLAREVLDLNFELAQWGHDSFYTAARGYAVYQFVTDCVRQYSFSPSTARAYALREAAESQSYFGIKVAELDAARNPRGLRPGPLAERYEVERKLIDGAYGAGFPREIYLGTELPELTGPRILPRERREAARDIGCPAGQVANYYGRLVGNSERGFQLDPEKAFEKVCATEINDRKAAGINGLLMNRFRDFSPRGYHSENDFRNMLQELNNTLNQHLRNLARLKQNEENANRDPSAEEAEIEKRELLIECRAMRDMALALREMLSNI